MKSKSLGHRILQQRYLLLLTLPAVIWMIIFNYIPLYGIVIAFKDFNVGLGFMKSPWVGLKYFRELFTDPTFYQSLRVTIMYSLINLIAGFPVPIIFAILINEVSMANTYKKVVQTASYLPHFLSWAFVASFLIDFLSEKGLFNTLLLQLGLIDDAVPILANPKYFVLTIVLSSIWKGFGYSSIIYLSAIASVDQELYEAAEIDGANRFQRMWHITFSSIRPTITVLLILNISTLIGSNFEQFYLLQNPLVKEYSNVLDVYTYHIGFELGRFSYGTAVGLFKSVVSLVLLVFANSLAKRVSGDSIF